jgi:hypothetical protein
MINRLFIGIKSLVMSSAMKPDVVFVLGAPGAGKGTQCENIVKVSSDVTVYCLLSCPF